MALYITQPKPRTISRQKNGFVLNFLNGVKKIMPFIVCYLLYGIHLAHAAEYKITQSLPCVPGADQSNCITAAKTASQLGGIVGYAANLWSFGIAIGGILALASIVYGAIEWTVSAGNESKIGDAKDRITQAVIGLVLLFSAYTVLGFINPELTNLGHIENILSKVVENAPPAPAEATGPGTTTPACDTCIGGFGSLIDPVIIVPDIIPLKSRLVDWCDSQTPAGPSGGTAPSGQEQGACYTNRIIATALQTFLNNTELLIPGSIDPVWEVTEAWPPNNDYTDQCHNNTGTCADIALKPEFIDFANGVGCSKIAELIQVAKNQGLAVRNEYPDCGGQHIEFNEGSGHLHLSISGGGGQSSTSGGSASCNDPQALAAQNNEPYPRKKSAELDTLISCIKGKLPGQDLGSVFTYENTNQLCNYTRGDTMCGACQHAKNSCHYGGHAGTDGAMAVDFGNEVIGDKIIDAALNQCGAKAARCEDDNGNPVSCSAPSATHVHANSESCDAN